MSVEQSKFDVEGSAPRGAVFLSYASQDAEPARKICEALRGAGVAVWFDQSELRGGDAWDQKIRKQIKECALFVPIISASTQARGEGYFRLEWRLADRRTELMGKAKAFLVPVCIDSTRDAHADVPESFVAVQWMRLPHGEPTAAFCERIKTLLAAPVEPGRSTRPAFPIDAPHANAAVVPSPARNFGPRLALGVLVMAILTGGGYFAFRTRDGAEAKARPVGASAMKSALPAETEAQKLVTQTWEIYDRIDDVSDDEWALAEELGEKATKLEPTNAEAWAAYASVTIMPRVMGLDLARSRVEQALKRAQRAVSLVPDLTDAQLALANCYRLDESTRPEAERIVRALVMREPTNRRVLRMAGNVMRAQRKYDESVAFYDRANALPGGDAIALLSKEYTLKLAGRFAEAEATLNQSFAMHPGPAASVRRLFYLLFVHDDLDGAANLVAKVPGSFLRRAEGAYYAGLLWQWRHETEKSVAVIRNFVGDELYGYPKSDFIGQAYASAGRMAAARVEWQAALQQIEAKLAGQPNDPNALFEKASLLAFLGRKTDAEAVLQTYEQIVSTDGHALDFTQADILVALGKYDEAVALLETGLHHTPTNLAEIEWVGRVRHDPAFDPLRGMPRFQALLANINASTLGTNSTAPSSAANAAPPAVVAPTPSAKSVAVLAFEK